jgi:hypothetical protein
MFSKKESKEKEISSKEVADATYEDFKYKLLKKKNAEGKQLYSAQLLGTLDFLGETLLHSLFEKRHEGGIRNKLSEMRQLPTVMTSLTLAGVPETEKTLFAQDLKTYLDEMPKIATKADLEALKSQNTLSSVEYTQVVDTQLETQVQTQVSTEKQQYIETQKKANPSRTESSLVVP